MKIKFTFPVVFIVCVIVFQSCFSPQNVIRLQPEKENVNWLYGQQFVSDSINGVIYEVGFSQTTGGQYWFDFNITNRSNLPILIDPSYFYIQPLGGRMQPLTEKRVAAIDPENEILEIEKQISRNNAHEMNQIGIGLVAAAVDVATGVAVATDDKPHNDHLRTHLTHHVMAMAAHDAANNSVEVLSLNEVKEAWETSTIRKTTLKSNYSMKGRVFFPAFPEAVYIRLYLPVDDQFIELGYKQLQFPVK
jgi:hypothetical protein